jgi:hypothetical protein
MVARQEADKPTGVIVLPAEDLEDAPTRPRTKPDGGLAFS